jgi:hypothetical protein
MNALEASTIKARNAEKRGDFAEAERLYGAVLERFPRNARARKGLDELFKSRTAAQLKTDAPPQPLLDGLVESYRLGRMMQVVTQAEALLDSHPRSAVAHNLLGAAHLALGQPAQAEAPWRGAGRLPRGDRGRSQARDRPQQSRRCAEGMRPADRGARGLPRRGRHSARLSRRPQQYGAVARSARPPR